MKFSEWLDANKMTDDQAAVLLAAEPAYVWLLRVGRRGKAPSVEMAARIHKLTNGQVTAADLITAYIPLEQWRELQNRKEKA